jgi:hypothetical protein
MLPRTVAVALGLSRLLLAPLACAGDGPTAAPNGAEAARFAFLEAPPPPPVPRAPAPAREGDEFARRSWEVFPQLGFAAPFCRGASLGRDHCGDSGNGTVLGGGALYRVSPYVALGAIASFASFQVDAEPGISAHSRASFIGFMVRGYFTDRGAIDPYVETGFGRGSASTSSSDGFVDIESESVGPSTMAGAGIDFWVTPYLRLGPALSYRFTWLTTVRTCTNALCEIASVGDRGAVGSFASLSFVATLALGREM